MSYSGHIRFKHILAIVLPILVAVSSAACFGDRDDRPAPVATHDRVPGTGGGGGVQVAVATAIEKAMPFTVTAVGTARASETAVVQATVSGELVDVAVTDGQDVLGGQELFTIDPQPFELALEQANAALARDEARAITARADAMRYSSLFDQGLVSRVQSENKNAAAAAIDATVAVDHTAVDAAERDLQGTHILAPVSGRLARPTVQRGDFVQSNAGLPLAVIDHVAPIYVTFPIPGRLLADLRRLQHAHPLDVIAHMANATSVASGHVSAVDSDLDADAMVKVTAIFSNVDRALVPGQFADVVLTLSTEPHALVVPSGAVQSSEQGAFVYVVNDESAVDVRRVQVERVEGDDSIIAAGLKPGDVVVSGGQIHLTPGARVLIHRDESRPHAE